MLRMSGGVEQSQQEGKTLTDGPPPSRRPAKEEIVTQHELWKERVDLDCGWFEVHDKGTFI
jgi:hypothetical protein